jgi:hypothetical protein
MSTTIVLSCPHCSSSLTVDVEAGVVVEHEPPARSSEKVDFDDRLQQMRAEQKRASDKMAEAMRKEKSRERIMEEQFRKLMDKAKKDDGSKPPPRDIDL